MIHKMTLTTVVFHHLDHITSSQSRVRKGKISTEPTLYFNFNCEIFLCEFCIFLFSSNGEFHTCYSKHNNNMQVVLVHSALQMFGGHLVGFTTKNKQQKFSRIVLCHQLWLKNEADEI